MAIYVQTLPLFRSLFLHLLSFHDRFVFLFIFFFYLQMMTDSSSAEDQQCNAAKLLEVTILQCRGHMDQVQCTVLLACSC